MNSIDLCKFAIEHQVNYLGFIRYSKSPRYISINFLRELQLVDFKNTLPVVVFVNPTREEVEEVIAVMPEAILQFHGEETEAFCNSFKKPYWKAVGIKEDSENSLSLGYSTAQFILFDTKTDEYFGGVGKPFDWSRLKDMKSNHYVLAGGIDIKNIHEALKLNPAVIDINSGIECSPGQKSSQLMKELLDVLKSL